MGMAEENPTFSTVRMREGYDIDEVDEFLDQARAALAADPPLMTPLDVETRRFHPVRLRTGYDMGEVDAYLDRLTEELRGRQDPDAPEDETPPRPRPPVPWVALVVIALAVVVLLVVVR
jgi:DivIVA domain-containing protein